VGASETGGEEAGAGEEAASATQPTHNLQLDGLAVQLNGPDLEVHANGGDVALRVGVISKTQQQAGLAHAAVANEQQFEEKVAAGAGARERGREQGGKGGGRGTGRVSSRGRDRQGQAGVAEGRQVGSRAGRQAGQGVQHRGTGCREREREQGVRRAFAGGRKRAEGEVGQPGARQQGKPAGLGTHYSLMVTAHTRKESAKM
jgi:hypothetical protein